MAITTLENTKLVLGISGTAQDALIDLLIPKVEADYLKIRNKPFDVLVCEEKVGIGDGTEDEFTLAQIPIIDDSEYVYVDGLLRQDYSIDNTTGVITFETAPDADVRVVVSYETQVFFYPDNSELTAIQMIGWVLETQKTQGISAESLGDHSITYDMANTKLGYPASIIGSIQKFASFV